MTKRKPLDIEFGMQDIVIQSDGYPVQIEIGQRTSGRILYVHVGGVTVLRIGQIQDLTLIGEQHLLPIIE